MSCDEVLLRVDDALLWLTSMDRHINRIHMVSPYGQSLPMNPDVTVLCSDSAPVPLVADAFMVATHGDYDVFYRGRLLVTLKSRHVAERVHGGRHQLPLNDKGIVVLQRPVPVSGT